MRKMLNEDKRVKYRQIEVTMGLISPILKDHITTFCYIKIPRNLTKDKKTWRVKFYQETLNIFDKGHVRYINNQIG